MIALIMKNTTELIDAAKEIIKKRYKKDKHEVAAAVLTKSGKIYSAVHLETYVGRAAICAEAIAIGKAASEGDSEFDAIVAVNKEGSVVSPCGICRELISDYSPNANVIIPNHDGFDVVSISELLPQKYKRQEITR